jgi:hypothetical protein
MMRPPPPCLIIWRAASWVPKNALFRLTSSTVSYWASVVSSTEVRVSTPALLNHDVQTAEFLDGAGNQPLEVGDPTDVGLHPDDLVAHRADLLLQSFRRFRMSDIVDGDIGAFLRQGQDDCRCRCCRR